MDCQRCDSERVLVVSAKYFDQFRTINNGGISTMSKNTYDGSLYAPRGFGIGGDENLLFHFCLNCGQIQGRFHIPTDDEKEQFLKELTAQITDTDVERVLDVARETGYFQKELGLDYNPDTNHPACYVIAYGEIVKDLKEMMLDWEIEYQPSVAAAVFHVAGLFGAETTTWKD